MRIVWDYLCYVADNALRRMADQGTAEWPEHVATVDFGPVRFLVHAPASHKGLLAIVAVCAPVVGYLVLRALVS